MNNGEFERHLTALENEKVMQLEALDKALNRPHNLPEWFDAMKDDESLLSLTYAQDSHDMALATADGSIILGIFQPAREWSIDHMKQVIEFHNRLPELIALAKSQHETITKLQQWAKG